ncbi:MAG TPA: TIM barrel protein [Streptosporangiaceae bacterium]
MTSGDLKFDVNLSILFTELPLTDRAATAAAAGFDAVEFWWPFREPVPADRDVDDFVTSIANAGTQLVALNLFAGDMPAGERGVLSVPGREQEFRDSLDVLTAIAERTGCRAFNALYGQRLPGVPPERQDELAMENLTIAADAVATVGGDLLLEPLTDGENGQYPLLHARQIIALLDRLEREEGVTNARMLADVYHLTRNGEDVRGILTATLPRIGHVQIADVPDRHEPGTGELDFGELFGLLAESAYPGYIGLEYRPSHASADSFGWLPPELRSQTR